MEVITIEAKAYKEIIDEIKGIKDLLKEKDISNPLSERWLVNEDLCKTLKISKRLLQSYRDKKLIPYSKISGKIYYRAKDIDNWIQKHYESAC
jgi:hypothetical protein